MLTPEAHAREQIDAMLVACRWVVQDFTAKPRNWAGHRSSRSAAQVGLRQALRATLISDSGCPHWAAWTVQP
jgi:hypothetical protein